MPERLLWGALKTDCSVRLGCAKRVLYGSADPAIRSPLALRYRCVGAPVATVASKAVGNLIRGVSLNGKAPGCNPAVGHHAIVVQVHDSPPYASVAERKGSGLPTQDQRVRLPPDAPFRLGQNAPSHSCLCGPGRPRGPHRHHDVT